MSREISYNLPGYGFANCFLFGRTVELFDLMDKNNIIQKTKNTSQLGTLKYVYPGAHHTRYEYIFTQWMLISNIVASKGSVSRGVELSLSSYLKEYEVRGWKISGGDVMQSLALLSNVGHMYDTFTMSRILMRLLLESQKGDKVFYTVYKRNLPSTIHNVFDELLEKGNYYKLHLFHAIHIVQGMTRTQKNKDICEMAICFLTHLINPKLIKNEATKRIFYLYKKIRKIAYLSVDMVYTPASFGANLSRMIYSISSSVDDLFDEDSTINQSISQLEDIIHKQIYDSPMCVLTTTRIEQELYDSVKQIVCSNVKDIFDVRSLILEFKSPYDNLHSKTQPSAIKSIDSKNVLLLSGEGPRNYQDHILLYDSNFIKMLPYTKVAFGTQLAQNLSRVYSAFGIISAEKVEEQTQTILAKAICSELYAKNEKKRLINFALQSIYSHGEFFFNLSAPGKFSVEDCVLIGYGCKKMAREIRQRFNSENIPDSDQLHEVLSCASVLDNINYLGLVICFVGGIKACKYKKTQKIDELDGFIYFPTRSVDKGFALIVEAKNYKFGENDAEKQLKDTQNYLSIGITCSINKLNKCAYMQLSI